MDDALNIAEQICHRFEFSNHLMFFPQLGVIISAFRSHRCREAYSTVSLNESHIAEVSLQINYCELWELELQNVQITQKSCRHLLAIVPSGMRTYRSSHVRGQSVTNKRHSVMRLSGTTVALQ